MSNEERIKIALEAIEKADNVLYTRDDVSVRAYNEVSDYLGIVKDCLNQMNQKNLNN